MTDIDTWGRILDAIEYDKPPATEVAEQLAAGLDISMKRAQEQVCNAIDDGVLVEEGEGFGSVRLAPEHTHGEDPQTDDLAVSIGREAGASDDEPPGEDTEDTAADHDHATGEPASVGNWSEADFSVVESRTWGPGQIAVEAWMCRSDDKAPYSPWTDADAPVECTHEDHDEPTRCDKCEHHAGYKWGSDGSHEYVHADHETALEWAEMVPSLSSDLVFIQRDEDPFAFIDGDDVRDPETGEVHPAFEVILEHLGVTYADISTSGTGVHAVYRGEIPLDGVPQATFDLDDEPFGANDDAPAIEIYDGKHVCIATGDHVAGTGTEVAEWNEDALADILRANGFEERPDPAADSSPDLEDHDPTATASTETTDDIRDVFYALDRSDARRVADDTIVHSWNDDANTSGNNRAFSPTWGRNANGTANIVDDEIWQDTGGQGYGGADVMAAIDCRDLPSYDENTQPRDLTGADWFRALEHLRDLGYEIPELERDETGVDKEPAAALPMEILDNLGHDEARRFARKRGVEWPTTPEARERLRNDIIEVMHHGDVKLLDAPTALGKSYTIATEPWLNRADTTGEQPVVHLHETREARDQAAGHSSDAGVQYAVLKGRTEACPVAAGNHDPAAPDEDDDDPETVITINGTPASAWFEAVCEGRGLPFSVAHKYLDEHNDQDDDLPCCAEEGEQCPAIAQWGGLPRDDDGEPAVDVIHATHGFAHVPSLRNGTNIVFDERPDLRTDLTHDRVRRAVTAYLDEAHAPVRTFEELVVKAQKGDPVNEHSDRGTIRDALGHEPDRDWYLEADGAHTLAPALTKAIYYALLPDDDEDDAADANGRYSATVPHEPPRLDASADDSDGWNRTWVSVVLDQDNTVRVARDTPDMSAARSVIGLDAHPSVTLWQRNVHPDIRVKPVLAPEKRALWRRYERGLLTVGVGEATRPLTSGEYFDEDGTRAFFQALQEHFGDRFRSVITAASVEHRIEQLLEEIGVDDPATMHYGEEKSRGDFGDEDIGALNGCIDPGDDYVLDLLAEAGLDATPETVTDDNGGEHRAHGRGFEGPDAELAAELLASVREQHVAQGAGRYARNADDPDDRAVVFVRTDAAPPGFLDMQVPGVEWLATDQQREIVKELQDRPHATARELADATDSSKEHVRETLERLREDDVVSRREHAGAHGAHLYRALGGLTGGGSVDLDPDSETTSDDVSGIHTWSLAVSPVTASGSVTRTSTSQSTHSDEGVSAEDQRDLFGFDDDPPSG